MGGYKRLERRDLENWVVRRWVQKAHSKAALDERSDSGRRYLAAMAGGVQVEKDFELWKLCKGLGTGGSKSIKEKFESGWRTKLRIDG